MTKPPRLYPGHKHQWASTTCGRIHGFGEDCSHPSADMVRCTVCGFQAPRNAAGLDGRLYSSRAEDLLCSHSHNGLRCALPANHGNVHHFTWQSQPEQTQEPA